MVVRARWGEGKGATKWDGGHLLTWPGGPDCAVRDSGRESRLWRRSSELSSDILQTGDSGPALVPRFGPE